MHAIGRDAHWSCSADAPRGGFAGASRVEGFVVPAAVALSLLVLVSSPARALDLTSADAQLVRPRFHARWRAASSAQTEKECRPS